MLVVETIGKIRRAFFRQGKSIKAICRELGISRKVVRKVIRSGATEFHYEREEQPLPKIGRWRDTLDQLLLANEAKAARERLTLIRLFEELRGRGYDGGYDAVRRYARRWAKEHGAATASVYVPLSFAPGEAYQFDWSHEVVLLSGVTVTVKVAHIRLCHSRMLFVRAYPRETQEMVFDAHDRAFALFKGTCTSRHLRQHEDGGGDGLRRQGPPLQSPLPADVQPLSDRSSGLHAGLGLGEGTGREPGRAGPRALLHAAAAVQDLRRAERLAARSMHRLRQGAPPSRVGRADDLGGVRGGTAEARPLCRPVRRIPRCAGFGVQDLPGALRQQQVLGGRQRGRAPGRGPCLCRPHRDPSGRADCRRASRARFGRGQTVYDPWHYVPVLARKPGALRNGAPFKDWVLPAAMDRVRRKLAGVDDGNRQMVDILTAVLTDGLPAVEAACAEAIDHGVHSADVILNILARQRDPGPPVTVLTPAALTLRHAPVADCARYDNLRRTI